MSLKSLATGVAAVAAIGAATAGVTSLASVARVNPGVQLAVFGAPMPSPASGWGPRGAGEYPQAPAADVPAPDALMGVLNGLADPNVPFANKSGLVEGGIGRIEAHAADKRLQKAAQNGQLPLSFNIANIAPSGPGAATADVTASGPQMSARTMNVTFINQDGWKLSRDSAMTLLQAAAG